MIRTVVAAALTLALVFVPAGIASAEDPPGDLIGSAVPAPWHPDGRNGLHPDMTGGIPGGEPIGGWSPSRSFANPPTPLVNDPESGVIACPYSAGCVPYLGTFGELSPNYNGTAWQMTYGERAFGESNQGAWRNYTIQSKCVGSQSTPAPSAWTTRWSSYGWTFGTTNRDIVICPSGTPWLYEVRIIAYQTFPHKVAPRYYTWTAGKDFTEYTTDDVLNCIELHGIEACMKDDDLSPEDATDFNKVCAGAPDAEWLSFSWLGPWVGHYASCLFVPRAGFPTETVQAHYDATALGQFHGLYNGVKDSVSLAGSCGVIYSGSPGILRGSTIQVDTCSWQPLSGFRVLVTILLYVAAGFMVYRMVTKAFGFRSIGDSISSAGD